MEVWNGLDALFYLPSSVPVLQVDIQPCRYGASVVSTAWAGARKGVNQLALTADGRPSSQSLNFTVVPVSGGVHSRPFSITVKQVTDFTLDQDHAWTPSVSFG